MVSCVQVKQTTVLHCGFQLKSGLVVTYGLYEGLMLWDQFGKVGPLTITDRVFQLPMREYTEHLGPSYPVREWWDFIKDQQCGGHKFII